MILEDGLLSLEKQVETEKQEEYRRQHNDNLNSSDDSPLSIVDNSDHRRPRFSDATTKVISNGFALYAESSNGAFGDHFTSDSVMAGQGRSAAAPSWGFGSLEDNATPDTTSFPSMNGTSSSGSISDSQNYYLFATSDAATDPAQSQHSKSDFNQQSTSTFAKPPSTTPSYGQASVPSSSSTFSDDSILNLNDRPKEHRTLSGSLRHGAGKPQAEPQPSQASLSSAAQNSPARSSPTMTVDPQEPMETQQFHRGILTPNDAPPSYGTITLNFVTDGDRPFDDSPKSSNNISYRQYTRISTEMTVSLLMSKLRLQIAEMKGFTVMFKRKNDSWGAGLIILEDDEMAERTLAELGWGLDGKKIWLAAKQ
ncbi:MAG: hypothetical protein Q9175_003662 [Cornicularia normoerica]